MPRVKQNPRPTFRSAVELDGLEVARVQKVNIPEVSVAVATYGEGDTNVEVPGKVNFGDITLEMLMMSEGAEPWAWEWLQDVRKKPPTEHLRDLSIVHYGADLKTVTERWDIEDAFVKNLSYSENVATDDAALMMETAVLGCREYNRVG